MDAQKPQLYCHDAIKASLCHLHAFALLLGTSEPSRWAGSAQRPIDL